MKKKKNTPKTKNYVRNKIAKRTPRSDVQKRDALKLSNEFYNFIPQYLPILGQRLYISPKDLTQGMVIQFGYESKHTVKSRKGYKQRYAVVFNANYDGKMHCVVLDMLPPSDLEQIMESLFRNPRGTAREIYYAYKAQRHIYDKRAYRQMFFKKLDKVYNSFFL